MTWRQLLDWANDPARTNTELRDAIVALEAAGVDISRGGSYKTRLQAAIAAQPDLTATAPWTPAGYIPPTPAPAPAPTPAPAQPVQQPAIPAATVVQPAPQPAATTPAQPVQPVVVVPPIQQQVPPQVPPAQPVQAAPVVVATTTSRRTNMRVLTGALAVIAILIAGVWLLNTQPWDNGPNGNGPLVTTATPAPTATTATQVPTAAPTMASPTASPTVIPTASETPAPTATAPALTADDIARAVADALAKALANQPAAPTPSSSPSTSKPQSTVPGVTQSSENCPTTGEVQSAIGLSVVRIGTEACGFTWRSLPMTANGTCPSGWICTLHLSDDRKVVVSGTGQTLSIMAGTFRFPPAYPADDAVNAPNALCDILAKEQEFGRIEDPSFKVEPMGFSCDGTSSSTDSTSTPQDPPANNDSVSECPKTAEEAASMVGGDAGSWNQIESNGWKYIGNEATLTVPPTGLLDHPAGRSTPGQSVSASEATLWCPA